MRIPKSASARTAAWLVAGVLATSWSALAAVVSPLGGAADFAVLGGSTVTNTGQSIIVGNVGVSPGTSITGFPPGVVVGNIHAGDATAAQAQADLATAYAQLASQPVDTVLSGQNLGGLTLTPGVYHFSSTAQLSGLLQLDAQGDPNGVFVFQIGTTLTTATSAMIQTINGASPLDIFWQVGSSATLGSNTEFLGSILAFTSINLNTGASLQGGRALAINGAVTLDTNSIALPVAPPVIGNFWSGNASNLWSGANFLLTPPAPNPARSLPRLMSFLRHRRRAAKPEYRPRYRCHDLQLTVNDPAAVTISGPHLLTIAGGGANNGITVNNGAGFTTINSSLLFTGPAQAVTVNNTAGLVINGVIGGANGLTKAGLGRLTLSAVNNFTGATAILQGSVLAGAANVIPNGLGAAGEHGRVVRSQ